MKKSFLRFLEKEAQENESKAFSQIGFCSRYSEEAVLRSEDALRQGCTDA
jgi:hypothetical protein